KKTDIEPSTLQCVFGEAIFKNLLLSLPEEAGIKGSKGTFQFIRHVEEYIHVEVKKLYPDAEPPGFEFIAQDEVNLEFDYKSARCMSHVCLGLLKGCAHHFNESFDIEMTPQNTDESVVRFNLKLVK
ncbi:heme NO-binding domain-containing protein, partial [Vibrio makurazakiensis]|uniref:heme NO-binding domain-containing protein n=1 Tax=Vibrio makurazakiensis TaxID=2910250 RepID=UPI003D0B80F6